jgi:hypothetical protein
MLDILTTAIPRHSAAALLFAALAAATSLGACAQMEHQGGFVDSGSDGESSY